MSKHNPNRKTYWLETYGCQMNKAESGFLEHELQQHGWIAAQSPADAEAVILNTCSVRKTAEDRIWGRLGFFKSQKKKHSFRLVLLGCMSERLKEEVLNEAPHVDLLVGNFQKHRLVDVLEREDEVPAGSPGDELPFARRARQEAQLVDPGEYRFAERHSLSGFQAFVPIMHGCNNFCTYCIVPYVRGSEVSRSPETILAEIHRLQSPSDLSEQAVREITLLGQNVNSYRYRDQGGATVSFPALLRTILPELRYRTWLRFLTSHPKDMSGELIELIAAEPALCRHIHLPVQHGSDRILEAMGRKYTRSRYLDLVELIRKTIPEVSLTTDILIGFPGESEEDFRLILELMEQVRFEDAFTYRYNPREGTKAFELGDDVPEAVKQERLRQVIDLQRQITRYGKKRKIGKVVEVLIEGVSKKNPEELLARTEGDDMVVFPGSPQRIGRFIRVRLDTLQGSTFRAVPIVEEGSS
ncbi:MAG: tRNA (N6-isopentenyl adenosine(37)-C2)-methylthiotransferase MiaB [Spirochaetaceae bacterium]|nr:MAG: tRNA (N6-isopentenyl adenosine(37)-C2)-methylthiotransferase MiaB [Spirochaetaceae bacterium]